MKLAVIPARGGSKRIPRKNIKPFCGKPMIAWSIEAALESGCFDQVVVSTDDLDIADVARESGAQVPFMRPAELSDDHTGTIPVIQHAVEWYKSQGHAVELVCCLYATAPFVRADDISRGLHILNESGSDYAFSVTSYAFPIQRALRLTQQGRVEMFNPEHFNTRSQDLEEAWHDAGQFYWGMAEAWLKGAMIFSPNSAPVMLPRHRVQDIDTPEDWSRAELMFKVLLRAEEPTSVPSRLRSVRKYGFSAYAADSYFLFSDDAPLKAHLGYHAAKSGDQVAAVSLVWDIALDFLLEIAAKLPKDVTYVAPFAREATGDNAIAQALAAACVSFSGGNIDNDIVQVTRVFHTGADPMERLSLRAQFEGEVVTGERYMLVDDVTNMGGTLAELADYIQQAGGLIAGVVTLVNAGRLKSFRAEPKVIEKLQARYENEILNIFDIQPLALTANEAQYLVGFRTADEIRNRLAKARKEIHLRLRSKGIRWADECPDAD